MSLSTMPAVAFATTAELLLRRSDDDGPALLFEDRTWSWREVVAEARVRADLLSSWRADDRPWHVGVLLDNTPEYLFLIAGAALSGATIVGVNPTRRGPELAADIRATDCAVVVTEPRHLPLLDGIDHGAARVHTLGTPEYDALLAAHEPAANTGEPGVDAAPAALDPATFLLLLFTSGSTGAPKPVVCSTGRFAVLAQVTPLLLDREEVAYNAMPMFHGNALMASWAPTLLHGATFATRRRFSASGFLGDVQRFGATYFNYVGRSLAYILAQPERPEEHDNRLKFGFGTEASARDREEFERRFGCPVVESYGSSEGMCVIRRLPETPPGALGLPPDGFVVDLVDADGRPCPRARIGAAFRLLNAEEAIGEIVSRGAAARFEGYYGNPEAGEAKLRDGDYYTGDLAYRDADGWFWFAGRTSDWLRVDSENFAAAPIERILARFPGVAVAAVYPVPDPRTGDRVMATLQLADAAEFDAQEFSRFLDDAADLGTKWAPSFVRITRDLPVTATRKVDKPALRRDLWNGPDRVLERVQDQYAELDDARRAELAALFAEHARSGLLG
ncbi:AMP-binding protein [soil metagenome]